MPKPEKGMRLEFWGGLSSGLRKDKLSLENWIAILNPTMVTYTSEHPRSIYTFPSAPELGKMASTTSFQAGRCQSDSQVLPGEAYGCGSQMGLQLDLWQLQPKN